MSMRAKGMAVSFDVSICLQSDIYLHMLISGVKGSGPESRMAERKIDAGKESRCNCTALRKATRRVSQLYDAALAPSGLKTTQRAILAELGRSERATVGELAAALVMDAGALAHTLKPLERDGFLAVGIDRADR